MLIDSEFEQVEFYYTEYVHVYRTNICYYDYDGHSIMSNIVSANNL